jgi:hypothetical protein
MTEAVGQLSWEGSRNPQWKSRVTAKDRGRRGGRVRCLDGALWMEFVELNEE